MHHSFFSRASSYFLIAALGCHPDHGPSDEDVAHVARELPLLGDDDACPPAERFGEGVLSTASDEGRIVFSSTGRSAYFHRLNDAGILQIMVSHRVGRDWSTPAVLPFSGTFDDLDPFLVGRSFFFASNRPLPDGSSGGDFNLWVVERRGKQWSEPTPLPSTINSTANELFPSVTDDGTLYFNSDREGGFGAWDIYAAQQVEGGWSSAENLGPHVNTEAWEFNPALSPDGRVMFFASMFRPEHDHPDIYATVRLFEEWVPSWNLGPCVNTDAAEYHPALAPKGGTLFFVRSTDEAPGDFFRISLE